MKHHDLMDRILSLLKHKHFETTLRGELFSTLDYKIYILEIDVSHGQIKLSKNWTNDYTGINNKDL